MSLLQSDMKTALKSAFGTLDGPLSVTDWCKGRGQLGDSGSTGDGLSAESTVNESKDSSSTVMLNIGEPISPSHSSASGSSSLKGMHVIFYTKGNVLFSGLCSFLTL